MSILHSSPPGLAALLASLLAALLPSRRLLWYFVLAVRALLDYRGTIRTDLGAALRKGVSSSAIPLPTVRLDTAKAPAEVNGA